MKYRLQNQNSVYRKLPIYRKHCIFQNVEKKKKQNKIKQ